MQTLTSLLSVLFLATTNEPIPGDDGFWRGWPFGPGGYGGDVMALALKFVFVAVIFGGVIFLLRYLFGPGGPMRDAWIDEEMEAERLRKEAAEAEKKAAATDGDAPR